VKATCFNVITSEEGHNLKSIEFNWLTVLFVVLILLEAGVILWFRKHKVNQMRGASNKLNTAFNRSTSTLTTMGVPTNSAAEVLSIKTLTDEESIEEQVSPSISMIEYGNMEASPPKEVMNVEDSASSVVYTDSDDSGELIKIDLLIEEAEHYAIHGRPNNAILILNDVVKRYPKRIEVWLLLLSIYRNKKNARHFESVAMRFLKSMGRNDSWKDIQEAGRSIDPDNKLYLDDASVHATNAEQSIRPAKRRLLGAILTDMNAISSSSLESALAHFDLLRDGLLGTYLVARGFIKRDQLNYALQQQNKESETVPHTFEFHDDIHELRLNSKKPNSIADVLLQMCVLTEPILDHVLMDFNPKSHGHCGNYLVACGIITQKQLHAALLRQLSGAMNLELVSLNETVRDIRGPLTQPRLLEAFESHYERVAR
jgi:hypothetical protein